MIAALLGWTKLPQWMLELIVIAIVAFAVWFVLHERYESGITAQQQIDAASTLKLVRDTDQQTAALQAKATTAEQSYEQEHQANIDYQRDHPPGAVRVCNSAAPGSAGGVPTAGAPQPITKGTGAPATNISTVPGRDSSSGQGNAGVDIGPLLGPLAARCDEVAAVLREFQKR